MANANSRAHCFAIVALAGMAAPICLSNVVIAIDAETSARGLFERKCAGCHSEARVLRRVKAVDASERQEKLETFMTDHHAPDLAERELLIRYLRAGAAR